MNRLLKETCLQIMDDLISHKVSEFFIDPVDPILDGCPDYFDIISNPIDLTTVTNNLVEGKYKSISQWKSDVDLIWNNAVLYNGNEELISIAAMELQSVFNKYTASLTDSPAQDWISSLNIICSDFANAVKHLSQANPNFKKRSPSIMEITPSMSTADNFYGITDEAEIEQLAKEISTFKSPKKKMLLLEFLKSMEPQLVGDKKSVTIDITQLSPATLYSLREEAERLKKLKHK